MKEDFEGSTYKNKYTDPVYEGTRIMLAQWSISLVEKYYWTLVHSTQ